MITSNLNLESSVNPVQLSKPAKKFTQLKKIIMKYMVASKIFETIVHNRHNNYVFSLYIT